MRAAAIGFVFQDALLDPRRCLDIKRRGIASVVLAGFLSFVFAVPVFAWQAEGGTLNCGQFVGFTHARYNDIAAIQGPGGPTSILVSYGDGAA